MKFGLTVVFLLLVTGTVTVKGSDALDDHDPIKEEAVDRLKRGFLDTFRNKDGSKGFDLEDALAEKPTDSPTGGACSKDLDQKLNRIIENQDKLLKLLEQQHPRSSSRFWPTR
ncbi:uncharacterized protein AB9X84_004860 [Acanthopagrus schlegelii]